MALTFVQAVNNEPNGTSISLTYPFGTTLGSFLLVYGRFTTGSGTIGISDTLGNTWHGLIANGGTDFLYWANNAGSGADTVTVTTTAASGLIVGFGVEYTGQLASSPIDFVGSNFSATGTSVVIGPSTANYTNETFIVPLYPDSQSVTTTGSTTLRSPGRYLVAMDLSTTSVGPYTATATLGSSTYWSAFNIGVKSTTSVSPSASSSWMTVALANSLRGLRH